jgi:hypothetical protein
MQIMHMTIFLFAFALAFPAGAAAVQLLAQPEREALPRDRRAGSVRVAAKPK